jgi:hypothetical protein
VLELPGNGKKGRKAGDLMKGRKTPRMPAQPGAMPLQQLLNHNHPLYRLAAVLNWGSFEARFGKLDADGQGGSVPIQ